MGNLVEMLQEILQDLDLDIYLMTSFCMDLDDLHILIWIL